MHLGAHQGVPPGGGAGGRGGAGGAVWLPALPGLPPGAPADVPPSAQAGVHLPAGQGAQAGGQEGLWGLPPLREECAIMGSTITLERYCHSIRCQNIVSNW